MSDLKALNEALDSALQTNKAMGKKLQQQAEAMRIMREALRECDEAMGYMSEYDIPLCMPDRVKAALAAADKVMGE